MKQKDTYKEVRTLNINGHTVRVHIPDITTAERDRRMQDIARIAGEMLSTRKEKNNEVPCKKE